MCMPKIKVQKTFVSKTLNSTSKLSTSTKSIKLCSKHRHDKRCIFTRKYINLIVYKIS